MVVEHGGRNMKVYFENQPCGEPYETEDERPHVEFHDDGTISTDCFGGSFGYEYTKDGYPFNWLEKWRPNEMQYVPMVNVNLQRKLIYVSIGRSYDGSGNVTEMDEPTLLLVKQWFEKHGK